MIYPTKPRQLRVSKLRVRNFRSIGDVELDLSPITLLVGPNASGKSNIVDALRFVSDATRWDLERAISMRHGVGAISRWRGDESPLDFEIGVRVESGGHLVNYNFRVEGAPDGRFSVSAEWGEAGTADNATPFHVKNGVVKAPEWLAELGISFDARNLALIRMSQQLFPDMLRKSHSRKAAEVMRAAIHEFAALFAKMRCYRIFPDALRNPQKLGKPYPLDEGGTNVGAMFRDLFDKYPDDVKRFRETIGPLLPGVTDIRFQLAGAYLVTELEHSELGVDGSRAWLDLSQESDGVLRALAMLGTMNQRPHLPLITIEEPEMALTPHSIEVIAEDLDEATYWSQVVLTTHSPTLIDQFPIESIRAVQVVDGVTHIGNIDKTQKEAVRQRLFSAGELHCTEGLSVYPGSMTTQNPKLIAIVEGDGDVDAVPILLRRILWELGRYDVDVQKSVRSAGGKSGPVIEFERLIQFALNAGCDAILIIVETDTDDCPMELALELASRATRRNAGVPISIVCPNSEYETWFIASLSEDTGYTIRRRLGISDSVTSPADVESVRGAKEWLSNCMRGGGYRPTRHQAPLTHLIDLDLVRLRSRSFRRLCHAVEELLHALDSHLAPVTPALARRA